MNNSTFFGYLIADPKSSNQGEQKVYFTLAVNEYLGKKVTTFVNCCVSGKSAETIIKYCKKGSGLVVSGRVYATVYNGGQQSRGQLNMTVKGYSFAGGGQQQNNQPSQYRTPANQQPDYNQGGYQDQGYQQQGQPYQDQGDTGNGPFFQ